MLRGPGTKQELGIKQEFLTENIKWWWHKESVWTEIVKQGYQKLSWLEIVKCWNLIKSGGFQAETGEFNLIKHWNNLILECILAGAGTGKNFSKSKSYAGLTQKKFSWLKMLGEACITKLL